MVFNFSAILSETVNGLMEIGVKKGALSEFMAEELRATVL